jgi:hypothetical protein
MSGNWASLLGKPFVTVSPTGGGTPPNNGADYGPDTLLNNVGPGKTVTSGIQEAIMALASSGGTVYCLAGSFVISASLFNTGNYQVVQFSAGAILEFQATGTYVTSDLNGPSDVLVGTQRSPSELNFHDCYWIGDGTQIVASGISGEQVFAAQHSASSVDAVGYKLVVQGFSISNVGGTAFIIGANNYTSGVTYTQQIRQTRFSRISATWASGVSGSGLVIEGSAREVIIEDVTLDTTNMVASSGYNNCFIRGAGGDTEDIVISRSTFIQAPSGGNVFQISANTGSNNPTAARYCFNIRFEDCVFDSKSSSVEYKNSGGAWVLDNNTGSSHPGFVYNIEFCRCQFLNVGITFQSSATGLSQFGYIRFSEGSIPGGFSGSLLGRGPGDPGTGITLASGSDYTNLDGFEERIIISGGGTTSISLNGQLTGLLSGAFILRNGDYLTIAYPMMMPPAVSLKQPL